MLQYLTSVIGTADCGGPFDLWEPNTTFSSPNYPHAYGHEAECEQLRPDIFKLSFSPVCPVSSYKIYCAAAGLWTLHTSEGRNIQLHFLDFDIEVSGDVVEVRDGTGSDSILLGEDAI